MFERIKTWWLTRKGVVDIGTGDPLDQRPVRQIHELTIDDIPFEVRQDYEKKLRDRFYEEFDFMSLYRLEEEPGFERFVPWITMIVAVLTLFITWRR